MVFKKKEWPLGLVSCRQNQVHTTDRQTDTSYGQGEKGRGRGNAIAGWTGVKLGWIVCSRDSCWRIVAYTIRTYEYTTLEEGATEATGATVLGPNHGKVRGLQDRIPWKNITYYVHSSTNSK